MVRTCLLLVLSKRNGAASFRIDRRLTPHRISQVRTTRFSPSCSRTLALAGEKRIFETIYMHQLQRHTPLPLARTLLQSPGLTALTLLDEPEVSLHPIAKLLADLLREASERTQLIVATHSDRLIRFLKPEEIVLIDPTKTA